MVNVCGQLRDILKLTVFFQLCSNSLKIFFSFNMTNSASVHKARSKKNGFPSLVWKNLTGLHRALTSTPPDINEPDLLTQRRCWTSLKLLRLNWSKITAARFQSLVKSSSCNVLVFGQWDADCRLLLSLHLLLRSGHLLFAAAVLQKHSGQVAQAGAL